ncbi:hypothetical protein FA95DRAFT_727591 [Auriscalpium vulgare]|uniref:Uncharacterized protein n=1 Tax=Auriscalpium vulgare TaxID=40419 RepID=A0ACB8SBS8_9AGAM|nr:hypothetical protein FA95DRAFT_727591 [Auriscalpium vulgare]
MCSAVFQVCRPAVGQDGGDGAGAGGRGSCRAGLLRASIWRWQGSVTARREAAGGTDPIARLVTPNRPACARAAAVPGAMSTCAVPACACAAARAASPLPCTLSALSPAVTPSQAHPQPRHPPIPFHVNIFYS